MNFLMSILCYFDRYNLLSCHTEECCTTWTALVEQLAFPMTIFFICVLMLVAKFELNDFHDWGARVIDWAWHDEKRQLPIEEAQAPTLLQTMLSSVLDTASSSEASRPSQSTIDSAASVHSQLRAQRSSVNSLVTNLSESSSSRTQSSTSRTHNPTPAPSSHSSSIPELVPISEIVPPSPPQPQQPQQPQQPTTRRRRRRQL